jgi:molybdopterin-containing oxidoreductase family iron-sulfur binding subunit
MSELSRRGFLKSAAGGAIIGAGVKNKSFNQLIPYVIPPENITPGVWNFIATTCRECPAGCGMHLWHRDGRVTKAEGNPDHPVNRGGLCPRGQSSLQGLYDPDRLQQVIYRPAGGTPETPAWAMAIEEIGNRIKHAPGKVALMSGLQTGALAELMKGFVSAAGSERLVFYEPFSFEPLRVAHESVFGLNVIPDYRLDTCSFIISFAADFLEGWVSPLRFAQQFASMRTYRDGGRGRMAYVGPRLSLTAANADDFIQVPPGAEYWVAMAMLSTIIKRGWARADAETIAPLVERFDLTVPDALASAVTLEQIEELADIFVHAPVSLALAGPVGASGSLAYQTAVAAALLNWVAGRVGQTVDFSRAHALSQASTHAQVQAFLESLTTEDTLIICEANPVYSFPGTAEHLRRAGCVVYLGTMPDETSELATWVLPVNSPLESWGDYSPAAGMHGLLQPTMASLYDTMYPGEILLGMSQVAEMPVIHPGFSEPAVDFTQWLRQRWQTLAQRLAPGQVFEDFWRDALHAGGVWQDVPAVVVRLNPQLSTLNLDAWSPAPLNADTASLWLWAPIMMYDGRVANRGWLHENPEPVSYVAWGNYLDLHPRKAAALGFRSDDMVEVKAPNGEAIEAPVRITEDVAEDVVAIGFGYGHTAMGRNAAGRGANAFRLLSGAVNAGPFGQVTLRKTGGSYAPLCAAATQEQHHREIIQWVALSELRKMKPGDGTPVTMPLPEGYHPDKDLYPPHEYPAHRWAMVIDLARCIGCGACAVACYAENNLAVIGEARMREGRQMSWLRVIPYRDDEDPRRIEFIPMLCQHCDAAPCEPVCPVFASVHTDEGLNAQIFNRCIGTRFCSNNCPYKVRRFNWLNVDWPEPLTKQLNPEVTVRSRGVMEKCTFCIQRIRQAEHTAKWERRPVRDGEIQPACAQSCPTRAIRFGDLLDPSAEVTRLTREDPRRYHVLEELNTKPAVTYLRSIRRDVET